MALFDVQEPYTCAWLQVNPLKEHRRLERGQWTLLQFEEWP